MWYGLEYTNLNYIMAYNNLSAFYVTKPIRI
jgi:hypothetical protein